MGQWPVYEFLKENKGEWFTIRQISEHLGVSSGSAANGAKKLREAGFVEFRKLKQGSKDFFAYRFKGL